MTIGGFYARGRIVPEATVDFALFVAAMLLIVWLLWPSSRDEASEHDQQDH